jgi:hypothetical protein
MMRPDFRNDNDGDGWEIRGEYDGLMDELGLDDAVVLEAVFCLGE